MGANNSINLDNIYLSHSSFNRPQNYVYGEQDNKLDVSVSVSVQSSEEENRLLSHLEVTVFLTQMENKHKLASIGMAGEFSYSEGLSISLEDFGHINAPAILYPFIREHLASLAAKANIKRILLPPFNFVSFYKKQKEEKEQKEQSS